MLKAPLQFKLNKAQSAQNLEMSQIYLKLDFLWVF